VAAWHTRHGDPGWAARRARLQALLAEAEHLQSVAELVGTAALPGRERVVLLTARLVREGVLQQSALSPNDATCGATKQAALADAMLAVHDRAQGLVEEGRPEALLEAVDYSPLLRAGSDLGPDDGDGVASRQHAVLTALEQA
jgi:V/A-type H+-transporting ATPase subunit A